MSGPNLCSHFETIYGDRRNITDGMKTSSYEPVLDPGEVRDLESHAKVNRKKKAKRKLKTRLNYYCEHYYDSIGRDTARASLWFR